LAIRLAVHLERSLHQHAKRLPGHRADLRGGVLEVQRDGFHGHPPHVVLALVERAVADAHRPRALVAAQVIEHLLVQIALAVDAVHDLQRPRADSVHEEREIAERLPVEAELVQR
jgi:hypothetical protein